MIKIALEDCYNVNCLNEEEIDLILMATESCVSRLYKNYSPCFNHMDLHWHNVFVDGNSVAGVIDFGSSCYAPKFSDEYRINAGFLYGDGMFYDDILIQPEELTKDEIFAAKINSLIDYYVFLTLTNQTEQIRELIMKECKEYIESTH